MKKRTICLIVIMAVLVLTSCGKDNESVEPSAATEEAVQPADTQEAVQEQEEKAEPTAEAAVTKAAEPAEDKTVADQKPEEKEDALKADFMEKTGKKDEDIVTFYEDDFDHDGIKEAFVIVGEAVEDYGDYKVIDGNVWFIGSKECKKICETMGMGFSDAIRDMKLGDTDYLLFDEIFVTALLTDVWYVSEGRACEASFSKVGQVMEGLEGDPDRFRIVDSSYDALYETADDIWMGHTWKSYYFFYDSEDGKIHEYGGTEIDDATAEYWCGRDIVEEFLPKGDKINSLFCRGNSLIVMNYEHEEDGCINYYHYIYDFNKGCLVDDSRGETTDEPLAGIYLEALCPEMASYPEVPGPNM